MTNSKKIILVVIMIACVVAIYSILKKGEPITESIKKAIDKKTDSETDKEDSLPPIGNPNKLVKMGSKGVEVEYLQSYLNKNHGTNLATDGIIGEKTFAVLLQYGYPLPSTINDLII